MCLCVHNGVQVCTPGHVNEDQKGINSVLPHCSHFLRHSLSQNLRFTFLYLCCKPGSPSDLPLFISLGTKVTTCLRSLSYYTGLGYIIVQQVLFPWTILTTSNTLVLILFLSKAKTLTPRIFLYIPFLKKTK